MDSLSERDLGESSSGQILLGKDRNLSGKKKKRSVHICTVNCRYDVLRQVAYSMGMREVGEDDDWNILWTDYSTLSEKYKQMKPFQKINHFPGMAEICRKDQLAKNLNRMYGLFPSDYKFFPKSWCLPYDFEDLENYYQNNKSKTFIIKPNMGCQGRGILITKNIYQANRQERVTCQEYIDRPFLIDGFKFDFRIYCLVTSCDPLRIFVYNDGLVRFATAKYSEPTGENTSNIYMHLTNYALNKYSKVYVVDDELGTKRKISNINKWFDAKSYDWKKVRKAMDDVIIKTIIAAQPQLKSCYKFCFPTHKFSHSCFQVLGFDILLSENLQPFVLEVNHSPSFHMDSQVDQDVKERLLRDVLFILNMKPLDKKCNGEKKHFSSDEVIIDETDWEDDHLGNFRKVYPCDDYYKFSHLFLQGGSLPKFHMEGEKDSKPKVFEKARTVTDSPPISVDEHLIGEGQAVTEKRSHEMKDKTFLNDSFDLIEQVCNFVKNTREFSSH